MKGLHTIAIVTFLVFSIEALLHYNLGKQKAERKEIAGVGSFINNFELPPAKEMVYTLLIVGMFASITEFTIKGLKR